MPLSCTFTMIDMVSLMLQVFYHNKTFFKKNAKMSWSKGIEMIQSQSTFVLRPISSSPRKLF